MSFLYTELLMDSNLSINKSLSDKNEFNLSQMVLEVKEEEEEENRKP